MMYHAPDAADWHHWSDVVSGFVLGLSLAWLNFKLYSGAIRTLSPHADFDIRRDRSRQVVLAYDERAGPSVSSV